MAVAGLRPHAFEPSNLEPQLGGEAILINVVHRVVAVPAANHKHRVVAHDSRVAKPVQRLRACSLDLLPLVLLVLEGAAPQVIVPVSAIIASKDVHRAIVEDHCVVCARIRLLAIGLNTAPRLAVQIEVKQVIEVVASLALVPSEEVEAVHEGDASRARPLRRLVADWLDLGPLVAAHTVLVKVVKPLVVVCPCEEVDVSVCKNALVTSPWRKDLPLRVLDFDPFADLHVFEEVVLQAFFLLKLNWVELDLLVLNRSGCLCIIVY